MPPKGFMEFLDGILEAITEGHRVEGGGGNRGGALTIGGEKDITIDVEGSTPRAIDFA